MKYDKKEMGKRICFVSVYIGNKEHKEISYKLERNDLYDYLFFTNLDKKDFKGVEWEIIKINVNDFPGLNNVKISRYFKFMSYKYIRESLGRDYDIILYCDCYLYPKYKAKWEKIIKGIDDYGILQYIHPTKKCVAKELEGICKNGKDTYDNMKRTELYLGGIDGKIDLKEDGLFFENTVIGFNIRSEDVIKYLEEFWFYYKDCPTYRDQPLWNFLLKSRGRRVCVKERAEFRDYFLGEKSMERNMKHY